MIARARFEAVVDCIRPFFVAEGSDVELVDVRENCVSVHFTGLCHQCVTRATDAARRAE